MKSKQSKTLVFIDDSGDPGFRFNKGSSRFFVIAAVIFDDTLEAEKTALAIKELKRAFRFPDDIEFKFNKSKKDVRIKFLETVCRSRFKIRSLVVDKKLIYSGELKNSKNSFYSYAIKMLLAYSGDSILDAKIKLDGSGDRLFKRSFSVYLRHSLNSREKKIMNNLKFINSKENVLIQLADMIVGSIRRSYESDKNDKDVYKRIIKKHIEDEWQFK